jgi:uncharacterized protein YfdQ (DUF2303 family)
MELLDQSKENIAATLARVLPTAAVVHSQKTASEEAAVLQIAVPKSMELKEIDTEKLLPNPRRAKTTATMGDVDSFLTYVHRHEKEASVVWCAFNPVSAALSFTAVLDDHGAAPGWRQHRATFTPTLSLEWQAWTQHNKKAMDQLPFAEFLESNENDIASVEGMPTSLQMHAMATEFVARQDLAIRSVIRLQSGGVQLNYVNDADAGTTEAMKVFEKFAIGIPVFWTQPAPLAEAPLQPVAAFRIDARLKYRLAQGKVNFTYELIRPDRVHQTAAVELIESMRVRLGTVPLLMGSCT